MPKSAVLKVNLIDSAAICSEASEKDDLMSSFKENHNKIAMHHFFGTPCTVLLRSHPCPGKDSDNRGLGGCVGTP